MDNLKYLALAGVLAFLPMCANAEVTVKETTSPEFIYNAGYSPEISRLVDVKTKNPATPIPAKEKNHKRQNLKWYLWETIDPSVDRPNTFGDHQINYSPSLGDF